MDKKKDSRLTVKTALLNTVANIISLVVGMVMVPIIARVISEKDLGIASTFLATRNSLVIVATLAVYAFVNRAMLEFEKEKKDYIFSITCFCVVAVGLVFLVSLPFRGALQEALKLDDFLYYWLFVSCLGFALYSIGDYYCIFHNKSLIIFFIVLCSGPVAQFLSVGLAFVLPEKKYIGRVLGLDAAYIVVALVLVVWLLASGRHKLRKRYITRTLEFTVPVIPASAVADGADSVRPDDDYGDGRRSGERDLQHGAYGWISGVYGDVATDGGVVPLGVPEA